MVKSRATRGGGRMKAGRRVYALFLLVSWAGGSQMALDRAGSESLVVQFSSEILPVERDTCIVLRCLCESCR